MKSSRAVPEENQFYLEQSLESCMPRGVVKTVEILVESNRGGW